MPTVHRRIGELWSDRTVRAKFVHYTSAETALKIIEERCLWMRNIRCMSDYSEALYGANCWNQALSKETRAAFDAALNAIVPGAAEQTFGAFSKIAPDANFNTYISCFSVHDSKTEDRFGRLSMWRAFGANARVAIVFSVPWFTGTAQTLNLAFAPVAYSDPDDVAEEVRHVIRNIAEQAEFLRSVDSFWIRVYALQMLLTGAVCTKHKGFREEQEWRAVHHPTIAASPHMQKRVKCVFGIPQPIIELPLARTDALPDPYDLEFRTVFERLIIGPSPYQWPMFEAFGEALTLAGVANAGERICTSDIPIRS